MYTYKPLYNGDFVCSRSGFYQPNLVQRLAAAHPNGVLPSSSKTKSKTLHNSTSASNSGTHSESNLETDRDYPAPLVLPDSEISLYPKEKGQSLRAWLRNGNVYRVTEERRTVYISMPPEYGSGVQGMRSWRVPKGLVMEEGVGVEGGKGRKKGGTREEKGMGLNYELVAKYVEVFYHGMDIKVLPEGEFSWLRDGDEDMEVEDEDEEIENQRKGKRKSKPEGPRIGKAKPKGKATSEIDDDPKVGLRAKFSSEYTTIRSRPTPNYPYSNQLNLNDILDFAISSLPDDAFALLMLLEHDLYEEEEDEFVSGRAYGGSRVSVVSGARYWPGFDEEENVERVHGWPASHCEIHLDGLINGETSKSGKGKTKISGKEVGDELTKERQGNTPLHRALEVYSQPTTPKALTLLHSARLARTASHELGHCFGIAHCTYYACIMQGSASLAEDARQPPYLCPVDEAKVLRATGKGVMSERRMESWRKERLVAMRRFCEEVVEEWGEEGRGSIFECLEAWIWGLLWIEEGGDEGLERKGRNMEMVTRNKEGERVVIDLTLDN